MTEFLKIQAAAGGVLEQYFERTRDAEKLRDLEISAVTLIQAKYRGYVDRSYLKHLSVNALRIQCAFRGYQARKHCRQLRYEAQLSEEKAYYDSMATKVQKTYRGVLSRRYQHDYYKRQQYLAHIANVTDNLREKMEAETALVQEYRDQERAQVLRKEFTEMTENMHHLISTKAIPGVFNSKFGEDYVARVSDVPLEDHIREAFAQKRSKTLLRAVQNQTQKTATRQAKKKNATAAMNGSAKTSTARALTAKTTSTRGEGQQAGETQNNSLEKTQSGEEGQLASTVVMRSEENVPVAC